MKLIAQLMALAFAAVTMTAFAADKAADAKPADKAPPAAKSDDKAPAKDAQDAKAPAKDAKDAKAPAKDAKASSAKDGKDAGKGKGKHGMKHDDAPAENKPASAAK